MRKKHQYSITVPRRIARITIIFSIIALTLLFMRFFSNSSDKESDSNTANVITSWLASFEKRKGQHSSLSIKKGCHLAIVSTYPPRKCGIAEFCKHFVESLSKNSLFAEHCSFEILALIDPLQTKSSDDLMFDVPFVTPIVLDTNIPSKAFWNCALYINQGSFTHLIMQQEFGLTPIMWQLVDLVRWLDDGIKVLTVIHTPRAYPNLEETGVIRQLASLSDYLVVMSWHAWYSLNRAFGIDASKIFFIPHGVNIPVQKDKKEKEFPLISDKISIADRELKDLKRNDILILSNGLIHPNKGLVRLIRNLPTILKKHSNVYFYIVGREHPSSPDLIMDKLLAYCDSLNITSNIKWINEYLSEEDLARFYKRTDLYVTLFDEITPTSGTLLTAMAHGLPIVSTPYRFAIELLSGERGLLVPFENDVEITASILRIIENPSQRAVFGKRAQEFVSWWNWDNVASQYIDLLFDMDALQNNKLQQPEIDNHADHIPPVKRPAVEEKRKIARNSERKLITPLTSNPFATEPLIEIFPVPAIWSSTEIRTFDQRSLLPFKSEIHAGAYVLYVDNDIQVNGKLESNLILAMVGIKTKHKWLYAHWAHGIDFENIFSASSSSDSSASLNNKQSAEEMGYLHEKEDESVSIDFTQKTFVVYAKNIIVSVKVTDENGVSVTFTGANRFSSPKGLLGDTLRCKHDLSLFSSTGDSSKKIKEENEKSKFSGDICTGTVENLDWKSWFISSGSVFSHEADGQNWSMFGINLNIIKSQNVELPRKIFEISASAPKINFIIEGPLFSKDGFSAVNRRMWTMLENNPNFQVVLKPTDSIGPTEAQQNLETYLVYNAYKEQLREIQRAKSEGTGYFSKPSNIIVIFRNAWPPNLQVPSGNVVWIQQQPWEFVGIPFEWKLPFISAVDELWVPSLYCKESYIMNGIPLDKISVVPHGVPHEKFSLIQEIYPLDTKKTFKFLFIGGLLPRKGIDILLKAYRQAFTKKDDVTLIIHSIYGDNFAYHEIKSMQEDATAPEVVFLQDQLGWYKLATLYRSADVYVSPYRSEGFGLTILEAMACRIPPIVPLYGPALEFCSDENAYFVNTTLAKCLMKPCGEMEIFGKRTVVQPQWSEVHVDSLIKQMKAAVYETAARQVKSASSRSKASKWGWKGVRDVILKRVYKLVEKKFNVRFT